MKEVRKESGYFSSFDDTLIYYECHGEGQPIVFIYGIACLINHWHFQISHFSQNYKVIVFDIRGHHQSSIPKDPANLTVPAVAKDLQLLLEHLKIPKAHFIGHSFGVPILIDFVFDHPDMVQSLSFINGFAKNPVKGMFGMDIIEPAYNLINKQYKAAPQVWNEIWKNATNTPLAALVTGVAGFNLKLTHFKDIEIYMRGVSHVPLEVFFPFFEDLMKYNGSSKLKSIQKPTVVISGEKDAVTPIRFQYEMHQAIKGSQFVLVPYGSHCTQLDFPDYVNLKLDQHLNSVK